LPANADASLPQLSFDRRSAAACPGLDIGTGVQAQARKLAAGKMLPCSLKFHCPGIEWHGAKSREEALGAVFFMPRSFSAQLKSCTSAALGKKVP
jgi:hypothetical protein